MTISTPPSSQDVIRGELQGLSKRLIAQGLLSALSARSAEQQAHANDVSLLEALIETRQVSASLATQAAAEEYGLSIVDLPTLRLDKQPPASDMPQAILRRYTILPLSQTEHRLTVAVPYPSTLPHLDELQFATGQVVEGVLAPIDQLGLALETYLSDAGRVHEALEELVDSRSLDNESSETEDAMTTASTDDAPVVEYVNGILLDAIDRRASDIHFEPYENTFRIRLRIDGILLETHQPPLDMHARIAARLKVMARLDISERRLPQDGAIKLRLSKSHSIDFRVNSLPTVYGEKIVLRILDVAHVRLGIDKLGLTPKQRLLYEHALAQPQGMILATGPTGSGKTVTLYSGLNILNTSERNISTAEDPVEIKLPGINQLNVLPKIGLDFANALRAFLRQDPDVVMIGEIRDLETAEIAVKASQTGHLVLSTVHTNSAVETLTRLRNMGMAAFNIASSLSLIISQRLVRRLCRHCKQPAQLPRAVLDEAGFTKEQLDSATLFQAVGCEQCTLGYKGRLGIYELLPISEEISRLIMEGCDALEIADQARREGHHELRRSGLLKVLEGETSLEEISRVTSSR